MEWLYPPARIRLSGIKKLRFSHGDQVSPRFQIRLGSTARPGQKMGLKLKVFPLFGDGKDRRKDPIRSQSSRSGR
jgi:hypothetical protein